MRFVNCLDLTDQVDLSVADTADPEYFLDILRTRSEWESSGNEIFGFDSQSKGGGDKMVFFDVWIAG